MPTTHESTLQTLHAGLKARPSPQEVAHHILQLRADAHLPAREAAELRSLAHEHSRYASGASMNTRYRKHPGLRTAFAGASRSMAAVTTAAGIPSLGEVDPTSPTELLDWLSDAHSVLGLDPSTTRPARRTVNNRVGTRTYTWESPVLDEDGLARWEAELLGLPWQMPEGTPDMAPHTETYQFTRKPRGPRGFKGGHADKRVRYSAAERRKHLPGVSVRTYRRAVDSVLHLAQRTAVLAAERDREAATAYGKSRLAHTVAYEDFAACQKTAAFVAYYTARLGMRTLFTNQAQARPMDTIALALLGAALSSPTCRPDVIATVLTQQRVLRRLTPEQQGHLLGVTHAHLVATARTLRNAYDPARTTMVVRRGDDSSSWNSASRAFNQARTGLLNLTGALGLEHLMRQSCPGKVPALIASDVAAWHEQDGGSGHVDVKIFADLPMPWDVVLDGVECTAQQVEAACAAHGVDATATGWTQPYRQDGPEAPAPAPDLVHGCVVASPQLALALRAAGWFSGQS